MILSIVIPVYNAEKFLRQCLDSILNQDVNGCVDIILVNDGSQDESLAICRDYELRYSNIRVISQDNRGASTARNAGLKIANGEWIWFVDADDMIQEDCILRISELLGNCGDTDVFCFNHSVLDGNGIRNGEIFGNSIVLKGLDYLKLHTSMYLWDKIFRRSAIGDVRLLDGIRNTEDMLFTLQVMIGARKVAVNTDDIYIYNQTNSNSTLSDRRLSSLFRNSNDTFVVNQRLQEMMQEENDDELRKELKERLNFGVTAHLYSLFNDRLPSDIVCEVLEKYKLLNLYPVENSYNIRGNLFNLLLNKQRLFVFAIDCMRKVKGPHFIDNMK